MNTSEAKQPFPASLQSLFAPLTRAKFIEEFWGQHPLALSQSAQDFRGLANWDALAAIVAQSESDILVVRKGERYSGAVPHCISELRTLINDGFTVLVRHAERHDGRLRQLASELTSTFHAEADVHIYATPAGSHGFGWHYDAEDVFILQTQGAKRYQLRKNTVHPWPLKETLPADMQYEREQSLLFEAELRPGDWLYIPCGYWHRGDALAGEDASFSLAIGLMRPSAMDLYDFLRPYLLRSLIWRQRLPVRRGDPSDNSGPTDMRKHVADMLARDLRDLILNERIWSRFWERFES